MHAPNDSDGSEAGNKSNSPKNQRNPEQDPLETIHLPFTNRHKSVLGSGFRMNSAGDIGSESVTGKCDARPQDRAPANGIDGANQPRESAEAAPHRGYLGHSHPNVPAVSNA